MSIASERRDRDRADQVSGDIRVHVLGGDYEYDGVLVSVFTKTTGAVRYVVEDANRRLFIHNAKQLGVNEGWMSDVLPDAQTNKGDWGKVTQCVLRCMDHSPKSENAAMLAERITETLGERGFLTYCPPEQSQTKV